MVNYPMLTTDLSDPECEASMVKDQYNFSIAGRCGEAMTVQPMTLFVYSDNFKTNLVATVRVEIHARPVIYTRARLGMQS